MLHILANDSIEYRCLVASLLSIRNSNGNNNGTDATVKVVSLAVRCSPLIIVYSEFYDNGRLLVTTT